MLAFFCYLGGSPLGELLESMSIFSSKIRNPASIRCGTTGLVDGLGGGKMGRQGG